MGGGGGGVWCYHMEEDEGKRGVTDEVGFTDAHSRGNEGGSRG